MENYRKGKNVEEPWDRDSIPILNLPENFLWMHVMGGSKIHTLLDYAFQKFPKEARVIVWSGSGAAVAKTVSCAEIMKRECKDVHQVNRICYRKIEEHWEPLLEDLDPIVVNRNIPTIHIMLSLDPVNSEQPGYQGPRSKQMLVNRNRSNSHWKQQRTPADKRRGDTPTKQFAAMGVKDNKQQKKPKQNHSNQPQQQ